MGRIVVAGDLVAECLNLRGRAPRIVLVHGTFDLLHPGHIRLLEQARSLGDALVVAVESDSTVRAANTGDRVPPVELERITLRPITPAAERAEILAALKAVDVVIELDSITLAVLAGQLKPKVLVKGAPLKGSDIAEADYRAEQIVQSAGGVVTVIPVEPGYSTVSLLSRIRQLPA